MKPTKTILFAALILSLSGFVAASASAATIDWHNNYRTGVGGEFTLVNTGLDLSAYSNNVTSGVGSFVDDSFQTFCIEYNEYISKGQTVNAALNSEAIAGGAGGPSPDPISKGTAFLYSQFAAGTLVGWDAALTASTAYNYTAGAGRQSSAGMLQQALWFLEEERTLVQAGGTSNIFLNAVIKEFGTFAAAQADNTGVGSTPNVYAVNLTSGGNTLNQDQLYVGPGASQVPDGGASVMLLGLALAGLGAARGFLGEKH